MAVSNTNTIRVISGAVLFILFALLCYFGGPVLLLSCAVLSFIGLQEYFAVLGLKDSLLCKAGYGCIVLYYFLIIYLGTRAVIPGIILTVLVFCILSVCKYPEYKLQDTAESIFGVLYTGILMSFLYFNRMQKEGILLYILVFICSSLGDVFGYAIGRRFGKHKMAPVLSPKKSVEGLAAELIGVSLIALLFGIIFRNSLSIYSYPVLRCFFCGLLGSVISVFGDLFASSIKREYGIKDYGKLIPGHGGVLDRFDSVLFTAPVVYLIFITIG